MSAGSIVIDLLMKTGSFETDTKRAERRLQAMRKEVERTGKIIGTAIAAGAVAAAAGIALMVNSQRQAIDDQAKLAQRLNTTYESLANLGRAGELAGVGMGQVEAAGRALDLSIGRAIQGVKAQEDAFKRLGLSARELADLPLDQRIAKINQALRDNVSAAERSAVAADIFGAKNAAAIQALDPDTIAEAARQVEIFGLNLSDVDAAKVEMANDAMSTFGMLIDGVGKQLTVELAPILKAIGDEFLRSAEEAGGLGNTVQETTRDILSSMAFVVDAVNGVVRVFQLSLTSGKIMAYGLSGLMLSLGDTIVNGPLAAVNELLGLLNKVPGVDIGPISVSRIGAGIRSELASATAGFEQAKQEFSDLLEKPLAGTALLDFYDQAQKAGKLAAETAVQGRRASDVAGATADEAATRAARATQSVRQQVGTVQRQIDALVRQAATYNLSATEAKLFEMRLDGATEAQLRQARALLESIDAMRAMNEEAQRLHAMLDATPTAQLEKMREDMLLLEQAFRAGTISAEQFVEAAQTRLGTLPGTVEQAKDAMTTFSEQAARNMQDAFANFLFDPFEDGVRGMLRNFVTAIHRMVSELLASQLLNMLGNSLAGSGGFLGAFGTALQGISGARANGGPVGAGRTYLVGERGPELFTPNTTGAIVPNHELGGGSMAVPKVEVRNINVLDRSDIEAVVSDWMGSESGGQVIVNQMRRNSSAVSNL